MSRNHQPTGFTVVELLVVITIIGMLMGILLPAVLRGRSTANRIKCMNRMRQVGQAVLGHTMSKEGNFPGYRNQPRAHKKRPDTYLPISWTYKVLPQLGRSDVVSRIEEISDRDGRGRSHRGGFAYYLPELICPSDKPASYGPSFLSYVANCGIEDPSESGQPSNFVPDSSANGIFHNHFIDRRHFPRAPGAMRTNIADISSNDGVQTTLLLSENVDASLWSSDYEVDIGFVWLTADGGEVFRINEKTGKAVTGNVVSDTRGPGDSRFARPSSFHSGGVNMVFCDGHGTMINESIQYEVYVQLMTPNGNKSMVDVTNKVLAPSKYRRFVSNADVGRD